MKKVSLLTASVALALTGCGGGSDGGSGTPTPGGVIITGFDGYFNQAVVFDDKNNNGVLDIGSDVIFGLTNDQGQIEISGDVSGALALQTLTPGGTVQTALVNHDSSKYAGKYTIDMDHPAQAMAHELVFRAPTSSEVISPITDLVAIEMAKGTEAVPVTEEEAVAIVSTALGGTEEAPIDPYSDFVSGADANAELHKTAQILTESKAANPATYVEKSDQFAKEADAIVDTLTPEELANNDLKPVIEDTGTGDTLIPEIISNQLLTVNSVIKNSAQQDLNDLNLQVGVPFTETFISLVDEEGNTLFNDNDLQSGSSVEVSLIPNTALENAGIKVSYRNNSLFVYSETLEVKLAGSFTIELQAFDTNSKGELSQTPTSTLLEVKIVASNELPDENSEKVIELQAQITNDWSFQVGTPISNMTLDITGLFTDPDSDEIKFGTQPRLNKEFLSSGVTAEYSDDFSQVILSGTPTSTASNGKLSIDASDNVHADGEWTTVTFDLPVIEEGALPEPDLHPLEGKTWYMLEHGSSNGESEQNYASIWCDSIKFENGIVLGNVRSIANKTTCSAADTQTENATYDVIDGKLFATFEFVEDGQNLVETFQVEVFEDADDISSGAKTIIHRMKDATEDSAERYTYFSNKADIEKRINVTSEMGPDARYFAAYLPAEQDLTYNLGTIGLALNENSNPNDSNAMDAGLSFDVPNNDFTCATINEFFSGFYFTGEDIGRIKSEEFNGSAIECYTNEENGVNYASVDFDLPALTVNNVYSIIGKVKDSNGEYLEAVKFNIEWTGTGNNE